MSDQHSEQELQDRLNLIERMIIEGRRTTESWGWTFVLWGVVYYLAIAWSGWGHGTWAWPVTVAVGVVVTIVVASWRAGDHPGSTLGRAIGSVWIALAISMIVLFAALGLSGRLVDEHVFVAIISAILGLANGASALMLRWRMQFACAAVWWTATVVACFGSPAQSTIVLLVATFFCQIVFGVYGMIADANARKRRGPLHA